MATLFSRAVKEGLKRENLNYKELAQHLEVSSPFISDVLAGNRTLSEERAQQVCDLLKIDMDLYYVSRGQIPTDLYDSLGAEGIVRAFAEVRENHV